MLLDVGRCAQSRVVDFFLTHSDEAQKGDKREPRLHASTQSSIEEGVHKVTSKQTLKNGQKYRKNILLTNSQNFRLYHATSVQYVATLQKCKIQLLSLIWNYLLGSCQAATCICFVHLQMHLQIRANYKNLQQGRTSQSLLSDWCFDTMQLFRILYKPLTSPSFYFINFQHENSHRCK